MLGPRELLLSSSINSKPAAALQKAKKRDRSAMRDIHEVQNNRLFPNTDIVRDAMIFTYTDKDGYHLV